MKILRQGGMLIMTAAFAAGCTSLPGTEASVDPRQYRYSFKHIDTPITEGLLPPPRPDNYYYGEGTQQHGIPSEPYMDDLIEYRDYINRYLERITEVLIVGEEDPASMLAELGGNDLRCEPKNVADVQLPKLPDEPDLNLIQNPDQLYMAYFEYSEALYRHLIQVQDLYESKIQEYVSDCHS